MNLKISPNDIILLTSPTRSDIEYSLISKYSNRTLFYIHSFDHLWKIKKFNNFKYLTWSDILSKELLRIHGNLDVKEIGNTLFADTFKHLHFIKQKEQKELIIGFCCTWGYKNAAIEEMEVFIKLLNQIKIKTKVIFRPYPRIDLIRIYKQKFGRFKNVILHNKDKYDFISKVDICFHLGTTMGLEFELFQKKSLYIEINDFPILKSFSNRYN